MNEKNQRAKTILKPIRWRKELYSRLEKLAKKKNTTIPALVQDLLEKHL